MPFNQPLAGLIEPTSPSWKSANKRDRLAFYKQAGAMAIKEKRRELMIAIGSNGRRMAPRKRPRPDGADGPVMDPHDELSRTYRLLDYKDWAGGVTLFWHAASRTKGQRKPWATILGYHAAGRVPGAPVRDVRLSKRGIGVIQRALGKWWDERISTRTRSAEARAARTEAEVPKPKKPGIVARVKAAVTPPPKPVKAPKHVPAPGSNRPLTPEQEAMAKRYPSLRPYLRNPEEDF